MNSASAIGTHPDHHRIIIDAFNEIRLILCFRRHWITNVVFVDAINKLLFQQNNSIKKVTVSGSSKTLRDPVYTSNDIDLSTAYNQSGLILQRTQCVDLVDLQSGAKIKIKI